NVQQDLTSAARSRFDDYGPLHVTSAQSRQRSRCTRAIEVSQHFRNVATQVLQHVDVSQVRLSLIHNYTRLEAETAAPTDREPSRTQPLHDLVQISHVRGIDFRPRDQVLIGRRPAFDPAT